MAKEFSLRQIQVGEKIKRALGEILASGALGEQYQNVSITEVKITSGLKTANIFIQSSSPELCEEKQKLMAKNSNQIKYVLAKYVKLRFMPIIYFHADNSLFVGEKIEKLLQSDKVKKDL